MEVGEDLLVNSSYLLLNDYLAKEIHTRRRWRVDDRRIQCPDIRGSVLDASMITLLGLVIGHKEIAIDFSIPRIVCTIRSVL